MKKIVILTLVIFAGTYCMLNAQKPVVVLSDSTGWHKIGETTVDFTKSKDEIMIIGSNKFSSIKFKVLDAPINLSDVEVFYGGGESQKFNMLIPIKLAGDSRELDLKGGEQTVKKIAFQYKTLSNRNDKKAHLEVWGMKTNADKK